VGGALGPWTTPGAVGRCPLHENFTFRSENGGTWLEPPGGGKFSVAQASLTNGATFGTNSTGIRITYSADPGAAGVSLWRVRVTKVNLPNVRFTHLFSVPAAGVTNETRHMPWADFRGQKMTRTSLTDCVPPFDEECTLNASLITTISFLESEDTITHPIKIQSIVVTRNEIHELNAAAHHAEEAEALIWEREHRVFDVQAFMEEMRRNMSRSSNASNASNASEAMSGNGNPQTALVVGGSHRVLGSLWGLLIFITVGRALIDG